MRIALTREVSPAIGRCELTHREREPIDVALAAAQHRAYRETLAALGCRVVTLPPEPELPDSVFVEDVALVTDEVAVILRPGAPSRRPETRAVAELLARHRPLVDVVAPGTVDGGDVLRVGRTVFVGASSRTNKEGIAQLALILGRFGHVVRTVPVRGCLHLKSAVTAVGLGLLLGNRAWVETGAFAGLEWVDVHPEEPHAANGLLVGAAVVYPASHPRTAARLAEHGVDVRPVDVSELEKAEGAVTCCSLLFEGGVPG